MSPKNAQKTPEISIYSRFCALLRAFCALLNLFDQQKIVETKFNKGRMYALRAFVLSVKF